MIIEPEAFPSLNSQLQHLLEAFTNLKDVKLRQSWEGEHGLYLAESAGVIERSLAAGHRPRAFFATPRTLHKLPTLPGRDGEIPTFLVPEEDTEKICGYRMHRGPLAAMERPAPVDPADLLAVLPPAKGHLVAVLEGLVDHTNVGAVFRSAAALNVSAVLLSSDCSDPLYRRSIRTSMGAVFQIPWARLGTWPKTEVLEEAGYLVAALTPDPAALNIEKLAQRRDQDHPNLALALGSEGPGLTRQALANSLPVKIPIAAPVDSLNVSTAAAIAFWEARHYIR